MIYNINTQRGLPLLDTMMLSSYTLLEPELMHIIGVYWIVIMLEIMKGETFFGKVTLQALPVYYSEHDAIILNWSI